MLGALVGRVKHIMLQRNILELLLQKTGFKQIDLLGAAGNRRATDPCNPGHSLLYNCALHKLS